MGPSLKRCHLWYAVTSLAWFYTTIGLIYYHDSCKDFAHLWSFILLLNSPTCSKPKKTIIRERKLALVLQTVALKRHGDVIHGKIGRSWNWTHGCWVFLIASRTTWSTNQKIIRNRLFVRLARAKKIASILNYGLGPRPSLASVS